MAKFLDQAETIPRGAYYQSADPAVAALDRMQTGILWLDTTATPPTLKRRNAANNGWDTILRFGLARRIETATYTIVDADDVVLMNAAGATTINLLAGASRTPGRPLYLKNVNTGMATIDPNGAETIDGEATLDMAERDAYMIVWTGTAWETF